MRLKYQKKQITKHPLNSEDALYNQKILKHLKVKQHIIIEKNDFITMDF